MKFIKYHLFILFTAIFCYSIYPADNAFSQNVDAHDEQDFGNVLLINGDPSKNGIVTQNGLFNSMFVWTRQDSLQYYTPAIEGSQSGLLNQVLIFSQLNATLFGVYIDQQGMRNHLTIIGAAGKQNISKKDSTVSKKNSITISQKGNGNSATVIQN